MHIKLKYMHKAKKTMLVEWTLTKAEIRKTVFIGYQCGECRRGGESSAATKNL